MKASEIAKFLEKELVGDDIEITGVCSLTNPKDNCLAFCKYDCFLGTDKKLLLLVKPNVLCNCSHIVCENPRLEHARVTTDLFWFLFFRYEEEFIPNIIFGKNFHYKKGTVIGTGGFGFERFPDGTPYRRPQLGGVIIGDNVELGANNTIDRATFDNTIICNNVKTDNGVHIGHNCIIGDNTLIAAGVQISGSVKIGKNCWLGTNCTIKDHITIGDNVTIGVGAVVVKDIPDGETWAGNPAKKLPKQ